MNSAPYPADFYVALWLRRYQIRQLYRWASKEEAKRIERNTWDANRLCVEWGSRIWGRSKSAGPGKTTGGELGTDEAEQASFYVETTEGFSIAEPVLFWVYGDMKPIEGFRVRLPGQTLSYALLDRHWGFLLGTREKDVAQAVLNRFLLQLAERLKDEPFHVIWEIEEEETDFQREAANRSSRELVPKQSKAPYGAPERDLRLVGYESARLRKRH